MDICYSFPQVSSFICFFKMEIIYWVLDKHFNYKINLHDVISNNKLFVCDIGNVVTIMRIKKCKIKKYRFKMRNFYSRSLEVNIKLAFRILLLRVSICHSFL